MLEIRDVRIENQIQPAVTDRSTPEISFSLYSDIPDTRLENAEISVCGRKAACGRQQTGIRLPQLDWKPFASYEVSVCAVDNHGQRAEKTARLHTGRIGLRWDARWITDRSYVFGKKCSPAPMTFRKKFDIRKGIRRAFITVTAMGIYELLLNGEKVGNDYFAPGFTSYRKNLQYQLYDVTEQLAKSNTLIAVVAGGWAVGRFTYDPSGKRILLTSGGHLVKEPLRRSGT